MKSRRKLEKKVWFVIIATSIINISLLLTWFIIRINPLIPTLSVFKNDVLNEYISSTYDSYDDLESDIDKLSNHYSLLVNIEDINGQIVALNKRGKDLSLITKVVVAGDDVYLLKIYFTNRFNVSRMVIELIFFQIIIVIAILLLTFIFARQMILKPIKALIDDIRGYSFGRKPKKRDVNNEFDYIANEFVDLTLMLDDEKSKQNRIIASISHDIKTPLTSIIGYSDLLKEQELSSEALKYNEKINDKALDIKEILSTFDDYLLNQDNMELKKVTITIKDLVDILNNDYRTDLESNNIEFKISTKLFRKLISVDVLKLRRVFSNIVSNSTRYLKNGGKILITIGENDFFYIFRISDNGPGVDINIIEKIFDPLFTTDYSRKISGLGLSICKEFIKMHGGDIKAYNDDGLVIEFTLPKDLK